MKIWLITDTHFFHHSIIEYCGRPENHTELIIENWKKMVGEGDITFHLGDVVFRHNAELKPILDSIPGRKVLVKGNHDPKSVHWYMEHGFDFACTSFVYRGILFTHKPAPKLVDGTTINIHGHHHNNVLPKDYENWQPFHYKLAIEETDYKPVLLDTFLAKRVPNPNPNEEDAVRSS